MGSHKKKTLCVGMCTSEGLTVFSLNFSSAGKGPFMAGKTKNTQRRTFLG